MSAQDCEQLTLFPADFPASPFPWLESKREKKMIVTSGRRCSELSENCARAALSVRTYLELSRLPPGKWSRIWSVQAITSSCLILKLRLSELGTGGQESSLLVSRIYPTPTARDSKGANSMEHLMQPKTQGEQPPCAPTGKCRETADNAVRGRCTGDARREQLQEFAHGRCWAAEPDVGRVAHGIPTRVDRLKCLGNAVVPQQAYPIFKALREEVLR